MSPIDRYPCIVFGRTNIALTAMVSGQLNAPVRAVRIDRAITGINTVVMSAQHHGMDLDQFEYCEILAVSPVMASAPPIEVTEDEDQDGAPDLDDEKHRQQDDALDYVEEADDDYGYWDGPMVEDRPSAEIERDSEVVGLSEIPIFGRRLLLVNFNKGLSQFDMDKAKERLRRRLGLPVTVWQGRSFEGYCFIDNAPPVSIASVLGNALTCDEVDDYLLVQPVAMVRKDKSRLSPLGDWLEGGWKTRPVNIPDRRNGRSERPA
jgi:hypothetical protein